MELNNRFKVAFNKLKGGVSSYTSVVYGLINELLSRLNSHTTAKGNVHGLEKKDLNIDLVPNFPIAKEVTAREGKSSSAFMSPRRVDDYADANIYKPLADLFNEASGKLD